MFLMNYTRLEIAYDVSALSCYSHNPNYEHWNALYRLLKYLKGNMNCCLHFSKFLIVLEGSCDANWFIDNDEINYSSCYVFTLGEGNLLSKHV